MVSSVFTNRLRIGMLLQTDPTVIYGMGERVRRQPAQERPADRHALEYLHPQRPAAHTRLRMPGQGLAAGGRAARQTNALYFVARGDGSSQFSATLDEHNRAVNKYQRGR
jgi:UPF0755 protein